MMPEGLTPELRGKAAARKSVEEVLALAEEEGYKISDEQLQAVSGGERGYCSVCTERYKRRCWPSRDL